MNVRSSTSPELRLTVTSGWKLATCASLSLLITLLTASAIGHAVGVTAPTKGVAAPAALTVADAR